MEVKSKGSKALIPCVLFMLGFLVDTGLSVGEPCSLKKGLSQLATEENVDVGTVVGQFDLVGNETQVILKSLEKADSFFSVNITSRNIVVARAIDYEAIGTNFIMVSVQCKEQRNSAFPMTVTQVILLKDLNDNNPEFTLGHYFVNVSELTKPGSIIFNTISATDGDATNLYMQYAVIDGPYSSYIEFERGNTGEVTLKQKLNFETVESLTIQIIVEDTPQNENLPRRNATASLTIDVIDEDDMNPAFSQHHYWAKIQSNSPQGKVIPTSPVVSAADMDLSLKTPVSYSIWEYRNSFSINNNTGEIKLSKQLGAGVYTAVLRASQIDDPSRQGVATLSVEVSGSGVRTWAPDFLQAHYNVSVLESTPIDHVIINVKAVDPDMGSVLTYWLSDTKDQIFGINDNADVILLKKLDFETIQKYELTVSVSDNTYTSTTMVTVTVDDVNDNNPVITNPNVNITTDRNENAIVASISASDQDVGTVLRYYLDGEHSGFIISNRGEIIMSGKPVDFSSTIYKLVAMVEDNGSPPRRAIAHVTINFPAIQGPASPLVTTGEPPTAAAVMEKPDEVLPIVLGVIAAILLFVVIILAILLIRSNRNKRRTESSPQDSEINNRRMYKDENLDKAKAPRHLDPEGLAYRSTAKGKVANTLDLNFDPDHGETSDGATSVQENPLSSINHGYSASDVSDAGRDMDDIHIQTSVTPYNDGYPGYSDGMYGSGDLKTFRHHSASNSSESMSSDSTPGSKKQLVKPDLVENKPVSNNKPFSWNNLNGTTKHNSNDDFSGDKTIPAEEKPEITVYF